MSESVKVAIFCEHSKGKNRGAARTHLGTFVKLRPDTPVEHFDSWQFQGSFSNKKHPVPDAHPIPGSKPRLNKQGFKSLGANLLGPHCRLRSSYRDSNNHHLPVPVREALSERSPFETDGARTIPTLRFDADGIPYRLERDLYRWELYNEHDPNRRYRSVAITDSYLLKCPLCPNQQIPPIEHATLVEICER